MADMVNHPAHYTGHPSGVECIEITQYMDFCVGNAFKYVFRGWRNDKDNGLEDLEKALWYVHQKLELLHNGASLFPYHVYPEGTKRLMCLIGAEPDADLSQLFSLLWLSHTAGNPKGPGYLKDAEERLSVEIAKRKKGAKK